jgi:hypothetical protein
MLVGAIALILVVITIIGLGWFAKSQREFDQATYESLQGAWMEINRLRRESQSTGKKTKQLSVVVEIDSNRELRLGQIKHVVWELDLISKDGKVRTDHKVLN